jgi:iron complex outermembrane receptor protein
MAANERLVAVNQFAAPAATGVGGYDFTANPFLVANSNLTQVSSSYSASGTDNFGIFGSLGYEWGQFRLTAEGRYNIERKRAQTFSVSNPTSAPGINQQIVGTDTPAAATFPVISRPFARTFNSFSPRITLDYRPTDDILFYASAAKGVRSGGFNTVNPVSATGILASEVSYEEETNWTYEAGIKSRLFDRALLFNASVFHVDWGNAQVSAFTNNPTAVNPARIVQNTGSLSVNGFEVQAEWAIADLLTLGGSVTYSDPKFDAGAYDGSTTAQCRVGTAPNFTSAPGCPPVIPVVAGNGTTQYVISLEGNRPQRSVKLSWNAFAAANVPLNDTWSLSGRVDVNHSGSAFANLINTAAFGERTLTNVRLAVENDQFSVALWATNLFDEQYVANSINQPRAGLPFAYSLNEIYLGEGRRIGVTASVRF